MNREMYVKPEISIQEICLEPFMIISGNGTDIPFAAPAIPDDGLEDNVSADKWINIGNGNDLWDDDAEQPATEKW